MRPYKQYVAHGVLIVSTMYVLPAAIVLSVTEDWARGKTIRTIVRETLLDLSENLFDSLDNITDMSYFDIGERIEL